MSSRLLIATLLVLLAALPASAATVVHYEFNGNVLDSSGLGNHGTLVGSPAFVTGEFDGAIAFDNPLGALPATQYVTIPNSASIAALANLSFSVTMKFRSTDDAQTNGRLFGNGQSGNADGLLVINYNDDDSREITAGLRGAGGGLILFEPLTRDNPAAYVTDGDWHWVTLTIDRVSSTAQFFVDDTLIGALTFSNLGAVSLNNLSIGTVFFTPAFGARGTVVDDFRIFDIPLSATEVENLVTTGNVPLAPAVVWLASGLLALGGMRRRRA